MSLEETGAPLWATQSKQGRLSHTSPAQRVTREAQRHNESLRIYNPGQQVSHGESHHDLTNMLESQVHP